MASSNSGVGRTEAIGTTLTPPTSAATTNPSAPDMSSQLVQLTTVICELTSRMAMTDIRPSESMLVGRPPPAPPFSTAYTVPTSRTFPIFTYTPTPSVGVSTMAQPRPLSSLGFPHTLGMSSQSSLPPYGFPDAGSTISTTTRQQHSFSQPWHHSLPEQRPLDRMPLSRPPMVSASSCWGPPRTTAPYGTFSAEQKSHKVKMEPPRFDGTEVNNWIRGVQFYFDHVGTPEAQRLHYVIMPFEPVVADWIWNYYSSHEFVTWYEFLDDVRCRFDPQCYVSHVGLLKKLQQTGTVSDY